MEIGEREACRRGRDRLLRRRDASPTSVRDVGPRSRREPVSVSHRGRGRRLGARWGRVPEGHGGSLRPCRAEGVFRVVGFRTFVPEVAAPGRLPRRGSTSAGSYFHVTQ